MKNNLNREQILTVHGILFGLRTLDSLFCTVQDIKNDIEPVNRKDYLNELLEELAQECSSNTIENAISILEKVQDKIGEY